MAKAISLDNGMTYMTAEEAMVEINARNLWDVVVQMMDDETRERVHNDLAPCTDAEFLTRYLRLRPKTLSLDKKIPRKPGRA